MKKIKLFILSFMLMAAAFAQMPQERTSDSLKIDISEFSGKVSNEIGLLNLSSSSQFTIGLAGYVGDKNERLDYGKAVVKRFGDTTDYNCKKLSKAKYIEVVTKRIDEFDVFAMNYDGDLLLVFMDKDFDKRGYVIEVDDIKGKFTDTIVFNASENLLNKEKFLIYAYDDESERKLVGYAVLKGADDSDRADLLFEDKKSKSKKYIEIVSLSILKYSFTVEKRNHDIKVFVDN